MFVRSEDMIADIGTRHVSDLDVFGKNSVWINEIKLESEQISALENEILKYSSEMAKGFDS